MRISYDYQEMIQELKEEINDGILSPTDDIQILRSSKTIGDNYKPIIDWYYDDNTMVEISETDLFDSEQDIKQMRQMYQEYIKNKPFLKTF